MNTPLITVLMPCYNTMPYLPEALESIIQQTYNNLEILCINDGSTDDTGKILDEYAKKDSRIRVIHNEKNIKLIRSLNKGIDLASGEFIARMDADDISAPDRIEKELNFMLKNPEVDVVGCACYAINEKGNLLGIKSMRQHNTLSNFFASFFYVPLHHATMFAPKSVFLKFSFLEEPFALHTEDYELFSRMLRNGVKLQNIDDELYSIRINYSSVSRLYTEIQDNNFVECASRHWLSVFNRRIEPAAMCVIANRINASVKTNELKKGLKEMRWLKKRFFDKYKTQLLQEDTKEIYMIYKTHIFDICVQILKKASINNKLYALFILLKHADMFLYKSVWRYIIAKF